MRTHNQAYRPNHDLQAFTDTISTNTNSNSANLAKPDRRLAARTCIVPETQTEVSKHKDDSVSDSDSVKTVVKTPPQPQNNRRPTSKTPEKRPKRTFLDLEAPFTNPQKQRPLESDLEDQTLFFETGSVSNSRNQQKLQHFERGLQEISAIKKPQTHVTATFNKECDESFDADSDLRQLHLYLSGLSGEKLPPFNKDSRNSGLPRFDVELKDSQPLPISVIHEAKHSYEERSDNEGKKNLSNSNWQERSDHITNLGRIDDESELEIMPNKRETEDEWGQFNFQYNGSNSNPQSNLLSRSNSRLQTIPNNKIVDESRSPAPPIVSSKPENQQSTSHIPFTFAKEPTPTSLQQPETSSHPHPTLPAVSSPTRPRKIIGPKKSTSKPSTKLSSVTAESSHPEPYKFHPVAVPLTAKFTGSDHRKIHVENAVPLRQVCGEKVRLPQAPDVGTEQMPVKQSRKHPGPSDRALQIAKIAGFRENLLTSFSRRNVFAQVPLSSGGNKQPQQGQSRPQMIEPEKHTEPSKQQSRQRPEQLMYARSHTQELTHRWALSSQPEE